MNQEFVQEMENKITSMINNVHTALPGKIQTFDPNTCTATVLPTGSYIAPNEQEMSYPAIPGTPVIIPQYELQNAVIAFPIKPGDGCLILFSEQQLDYFLYGASASDLHHDMTSAIAIVGLFNVSCDAIKEACQENAIVIAKKSTRIKIYDEEILMETKTINVKADDINVKANTINVEASQINERANISVIGNESITGDVDITGNEKISDTLTATTAKIQKLIPSSCTLKS